MKIYIDKDLPESCDECEFLVRCDECEGFENYCPFIGNIGYDNSDNLKDGAPVTPAWERHEECPLEQRPHGECRTCKNFVRGGLDGKTYVCEHPDILLDDYFDYACITMNENDFCSRYEKGEGEKNGGT